MNHKLLTVLVLSTILNILIHPVKSEARIWRVESDGTGRAPNIQAGIDSCATGDTVLVAAGLYEGDGNRDLDFRGKAIVVLGESRYDPSVTDETIIDCGATAGEHHTGFHFHSGETNEAILEGFVIQNGSGLPSTRAYGSEYVLEWYKTGERLLLAISAESQGGLRSDGRLQAALDKLRTEYSRIESILASDSYYDLVGGAILCDSASSPTIRFNVLRDNYYDTAYGGGIACFDSLTSPVITDNLITGIWAWAAGAIYTGPGTSVTVKNNEITGNSSGGIYCAGAEAVITGNSIHHNSYVEGAGGGITCSACQSVVIRDNEIFSNWGDLSRGAIYLTGSVAEISGNTIMHNISEGAGGMYASGSTVTLEDNEMSDNGGYYTAFRFSRSSVIMRGNTCNGNSNLYGDVFRFDSALHTVIEDNVITRSGTDTGPGCVGYSGAASSIIAHNIIADGERAITCYSSISIINNDIRNNVSLGIFSGPYVGGIHCVGCSPLIAGNTISSCVGIDAGGIYCVDASPEITGNTIVGNEGHFGAGIFADSTSAPTISGNIISGNRALNYDDYAGGGGGISSENPDIPISCNDVYENQGGNYVGIPDQTGINGNISANPVFCDPDNGVYSIHAFSPCAPGKHPYGSDCGLIGALGVECDFVATLLEEYGCEFDGDAVRIEWTVSESRLPADFTVARAQSPSWTYRAVAGTAIEGGGTEFALIDGDLDPGQNFRYQVSVTDESGTTVLFETGRIDVPALPLTLSQNYPNPFNPSTTIRYYLTAGCHVRLELYDISGRCISTLVDEAQGKGSYAVEWNGLDRGGSTVSSGAYFYRLKAGKDVLSRKMVLLR